MADTSSAIRLRAGEERSSLSLFAQCSTLRQKLLQIDGFVNYFSTSVRNVSNSETQDPVSQLWDVFSTGVPLCYLFNQLPARAGFGRIIDHRFNWENAESNDERVQSRDIAHFSMHLQGYKIQEQIPGLQLFTITDLRDRNSANGFSKVVQTVSAIVDYLLSPRFESGYVPTVTALHSSVPMGVQSGYFLKNIIKELVQTEHNYVKKLGDTLAFSGALATAGLMDQSSLFGGIDRLFTSQTKFLSAIEETVVSEFDHQRWGRCFLESEEEFTEVYVPYCAKYPRRRQYLKSMDDVRIAGRIFSQNDLAVMLISPVSRVCKYPLLLESLLKAYHLSSTYAHLEELERALEASKRISEKINEAIRQSENEQTALELASRVRDWKGFVPNAANFGALLLDDGRLLVATSDISQEYSADDDFCVVSMSDTRQTFHVFLFEQILILCQEHSNGPVITQKTTAPFMTRNCPLSLQGHIFLWDITRAVPVPTAQISRRSSDLSEPFYPLTIWWQGEGQQETFFSLQFRYEHQMHQWQARINTILQGLSRNLMPKSSSTTSVRHREPQMPDPRRGKTIKLKSQFDFRHSQNFEPLAVINTDPTIPRNARTSSCSNRSSNATGIVSANSRPERRDDKTTASFPSKAEIKVIFRDDVSLLRLPITTTYEGLVSTILSSSRLPLALDPSSSYCQSSEQPDEHKILRIKYIDEDGDAISVRYSEDVQMFFEQYTLQKCIPKRPIVLLIDT